MASDSILTSIPFWIVIGVIFALAVAWAVCFGTRVNPFRRCADCSRGVWRWLTCCCPGNASEESPKEGEPKKPQKPKKTKKAKDESNLDQALEELKALRDTLPLLPLQQPKKDECKWDKRDYLLERAEKVPTVV